MRIILTLIVGHISSSKTKTSIAFMSHFHFKKHRIFSNHTTDHLPPYIDNSLKKEAFCSSWAVLARWCLIFKDHRRNFHYCCHFAHSFEMWKNSSLRLFYTPASIGRLPPPYIILQLLKIVQTASKGNILTILSSCFLRNRAQCIITPNTKNKRPNFYILTLKFNLKN